MKNSSMMRLEREINIKIKYQNQKRKYLDTTGTLREKSNDPQRIHKLNEETLTKITFQHNEQFDIQKVENPMQNFTLESEKKMQKKWKQKSNHTLPHWLLPHIIVLKVKHQKYI